MAEIRHLGSCRLNSKTRFFSFHIHYGSCYALAIAPPPTEKPNYAMVLAVCDRHGVSCGLSATAELLVKYKLVCYWLVY